MRKAAHVKCYSNSIRMDFRYSYLLLALFFLTGWLFLYWRRKNERAELLTISFSLALFGIIADILYIKDWWKPITILGIAPISGEAIIASFGIVGVSAVLPEYLLRLKDSSPRKVFTHHKISVLCTMIFTATALFFASFFLFGTNSLVATVMALLVPTAFMWGSRYDLIPTAILNGVFVVIFAMLVYTAVEYVTPGWVQSFWFFENTPPLILFNLPIDDVIFYFFTGLFFGTFYEWWQGIKRTPYKRPAVFARWGI